MPIDCLNDNVPVYDPDDKGCYRWMSIKAGRPSKFCAPVTFEDEICTEDLKVCNDLKVYNDFKVCGDIYDSRREPYAITKPFVGGSQDFPPVGQETILQFDPFSPGGGTPIDIIAVPSNGFTILSPGRYSLNFHINHISRPNTVWRTNLWLRPGELSPLPIPNPPVSGWPVAGGSTLQTSLVHQASYHPPNPPAQPQFGTEGGLEWIVDIPTAPAFVFLTVDVVSDPDAGSGTNRTTAGTYFRIERVKGVRSDDFTDNCDPDGCCDDDGGIVLPPG